jgi:hypothetical protein
MQINDRRRPRKKNEKEIEIKILSREEEEGCLTFLK